MTYRVLILIVLAMVISTSPSVHTTTPTSQNGISCITVTLVVGGGIVGIAATLWKLVNDYKSGKDKDHMHVYSDVLRMPSNHLFQPRVEEIRELEEKFNTQEKTNSGNLVVTCTFHHGKYRKSCTLSSPSTMTSYVQVLRLWDSDCMAPKQWVNNVMKIHQPFLRAFFC